MATEKRERHFLKRYLERRKKELEEEICEKLKQMLLLGVTDENMKKYGELSARFDELDKVIEVCKERGRF